MNITPNSASEPRRAKAREISAFKKTDSFESQIRTLCPQMANHSFNHGVGWDNENKAALVIGWYAQNNFNEPIILGFSYGYQTGLFVTNFNLTNLPTYLDTTNAAGEPIRINIEHRKSTIAFMGDAAPPFLYRVGLRVGKAAALISRLTSFRHNSRAVTPPW